MQRIPIDDQAAFDLMSVDAVPDVEAGMVQLLHFAYVLALSFAIAGPALGQEQEDAFQPIDQPSPVVLIKSRCVFCHGPAVMLSFSQRLLNTAGPEALDVLLIRHHAPDKEARDAIVRFLSNPFSTSN